MQYAIRYFFIWEQPNAQSPICARPRDRTFQFIAPQGFLLDFQYSTSKPLVRLSKGDKSDTG